MIARIDPIPRLLESILHQSREGRKGVDWLISGNNHEAEDAATIQRRFNGMVGAMARRRASAGSLSDAIEQFGKVTRSYRPGLFHCYAVPDLPRTNNDLEHEFISQRFHERRASGRKTASPAAVLRGEARLVAAIATRQAAPSGPVWGRADREQWKNLRGFFVFSVVTPRGLCALARTHPVLPSVAGILLWCRCGIQ
jgi:hypothetical protein